MDLASLQLEIDSRQAKEAKKALEDFAGAADKAESATGSLSQANKQGEDRYKAIARAAIEHQQALTEEVRAQMASNNAARQASEGAAERARAYTRVASAENQARLENERQAATMKAAAEAAERNRVALDGLLRQIDPLQGKLTRLDDMEQRLTATFRQGSIDANVYAASLAKINAQRKEVGDQQMRMVAAGAEEAASSMEKLGLNTSSARHDMMMLARAASTGDMRQASSSMLQLGTRTNVAGAAARAALNPVTLLATAAAGLFLLHERGASEMRSYNIALIETGYAAGVTGSQVADMAQRIGGSDRVVRAASMAMVELISNARLVGGDIEIAGRAIVEMSQASGRSVSDLAAEFAKIRKDPVGALKELNEEYGYLSLATYEQVRALVDEGRAQDAVSLAVREHSNMMMERAPQIAANIGIIERAWRGAKSAVAGYVEEAMSIGRARTPSEIRGDLDSALQEQDRVNAGAGEDSGARMEWLKKRLLGKAGPQTAYPNTAAEWGQRVKGLYAELEAAEERERVAAERAREQQTQSAGIEGASFLESRLTQAKSDLAKAKEIEATKRHTTAAIMANPLDAARYEEMERIALADIERRYKPRAGKQADTSEYRRTLQALTDDFRSANQVLDSERRANLVDEESYWQRKVELIDENERAQTAAMQSELARLAGVKNSAKQRADIEAQLAKVGKEAAKERQVAANQQIEAHNKTRLAVEAYIEALQSLVRAEEQAGAQRIAGMGLGPRDRELQDVLSRVDLDFANKQIKLSQDQSKMSPGEYQQKLDGLISAHQGMRNQIIQNYHAIKEAESEWLRGAAEGAMAYADDAANVYKNLGQAVSGAFKGMEDALTGFVTTGKMDFKSLADSIIKDMVRIAIQQSITGPLAGALGGMLGSMFGAGAAAPAGVTPGLNWTFSSGGYTGDGGRFEPAGVVHRGEGVLNQDEIRALGGESGFNALRRAIRGPGHAIGGMGGRPSLPSGGVGGGNPNINVNIQGGPQQAEVSARRNQQGDIDINIIYKQIENRIAGGVASGQGQVGRAVERRYGLTPKLG